MALADTARLIASLELQDKFSRPLSGANRSLSGFERNLSGVNRAAGRFSVAGAAIGTVIGVLGAQVISSGIRGLAGAIQGGVDALDELQSVSVATDTVIASTGGVAGISASQVRDLAESYEDLNATIDDKVIQSAENMLLTFTNVREEAFEPALEAALNMNEAMGGGEEGLQANIIRIGRVLQDPIRNLGALTRSGVLFTDEQREQIRVLQESGDLYGAQQVILRELGTEFGGRFAAAGKTAAGSQAALRDRIEDVQKSLAGPLIPAIDRVRDKFIDLLGSPRVLAGAEKLGDAIAGLLSDENIDRGVGMIEGAIDSLSGADFTGATSGLGSIVESVGNLPWGAIADAARLLGTGSKALLDAFLGLPPWVQTAVLTGWGLNKLTGGALTSIVGTLASGLIRGILNMNAGVVNINAAAVNGGGIPGAAGRGGGGLVGGLKTGAAIAAPLLVGVAAVEVVNFEEMRTEQRTGLQAIIDELPRRNAVEAQASVDRITAEINRERPLLDGILFNTNVKPQLEAEIAELQNLIDVGAAANTIASDAVQRSGAAFDRQYAQTLGISNILASTQQEAGADWEAQHRSQAAVHSALAKFDPSLLDRGTEAREGGEAGGTLLGPAAAVLSGTALAPVTAAIGDVETEVSALDPIIERSGAATRIAITSGSAGLMSRLTTSQQEAAADWDQQHRQTSAAHSLLSTTSAATKAAITTGSAGIMNRVTAETGKVKAATDNVRNATSAVRGAVDGAKSGIQSHIASYGAAQLSKQAAIAAAVNTNTGVLKSKNFAPKIKVTTNVTSNVTISEIQRKITSQQIASSVATGGGGFAV